MASAFFSLRVSSPNKNSSAPNVKGFIYYIAKRVGVTLNKSEVNKLSVAELTEKLFDDPLMQDYLGGCFEDNVEGGSIEMPKDKGKFLTERFIPENIRAELGNNPKLQLSYIAKRTGVVLNKAGAHGLFGKFDGNDFGDIASLSSAMRYVGQKVEKGTITYSCLLSFSPEDAANKGFMSQEKFKRFLKQNINHIADKIGVPASRLEYVGAVHLKETNPHMHFMFWDKEQGVKEPFVNKSVSSGIRDDLIKVIYKEELDEFYRIKNASRKVLTDGIGENFAEVADYFINLSENDFLKQLKGCDKKTSMGGAFGGFKVDNLSSDFVKKYGREFLLIEKRLPKTGSLKFEYLPPELKSRITKTLKSLIADNPDFKREFDQYVSSAVNIAKMYSDKPERHEEARRNAEDEVLRRMSNRLIKALKDVKKYDTEITKKANCKRKSKEQTLELVVSLFKMLSQSSNDNKNRHDGIKQELSMQAKLELARKMESASSLDWERD